VQFLFCLGALALNPLKKIDQFFGHSLHKLIPQRNGVVALYLDCAAPFEVPESARDRLNG
jgi:hypothetical protein